MTKPIIIAGAGPVGLMMALACKTYGLDFVLLEEDDSFSSDTKAGTTLTRTIEALRRYGRDEAVLAQALRVDEIGELERATNARRNSVQLDLLADQTRYPFILNIPQHYLEPILAEGLDPAALRLRDGIRIRLRCRSIVYRFALFQNLVFLHRLRPQL